MGRDHVLFTPVEPVPRIGLSTGRSSINSPSVHDEHLVGRALHLGKHIIVLSQSQETEHALGRALAAYCRKP